MYSMQLIFDIYPMLNTTYTGIAHVTWNLVREFGRASVDCLYTMGHYVLPHDMLDNFVAARTGMLFVREVEKRRALERCKMLCARDIRERIYFSSHATSLRTGRGLGSAKIIHDLSSLTFSQFHTRDVVITDAKYSRLEAERCDLLFTVSASSRQEILRYLAVPEDKVVVAYPGVSWTTEQVRNAVLLFDTPYVVVLATQEPRKNIAMVYQYLLAHEAEILADETLYVFAGPPGWGKTVDAATREGLARLEKAGRVRQLGFIHEDLKLALLSGAQYMIFPSFFEGFGLPVAEALSVGTPVVCSCGGSLPEVGGEAVTYFSPLDMSSLEAAVQEMETALDTDFQGARHAALRQGSKFTWEQCAATILDHLDALYARKTAAYQPEP